MSLATADALMGIFGMKRVQPKRKSCKVCKERFTVTKPLQTVCSVSCAIGSAESKRRAAENKQAKAERKRTKERLDEIKPRSYWLKQAQAAINAYIRYRDKDAPCISCQRSNNVKYNAGHYLSVGAHPELRFNEENIHKQCEHCNSYLSGNQQAYRPHLINKIGLDRVEWLEGPHEPQKYTIDDAKRITAQYRAKLKGLK